MGSNNKKFSSKGQAILNTNTKKSLARAISMAVLSTASISAMAQTELPTASVGSETEESYRVDKTQSFKYPQPLIETPKTLTIISSAEMRDRGVTNLRDALRAVPGISMAAGEGGTPSGDSMTIRGFNASTDIFADGIRDIAGYSRDTYNTQNVEVAKGPGSNVSGRGSVGGSINLAKKTALDTSFVDIGGIAGSASDYRATLDANQKIGESSAVRVNLLTTQGDVAGRDHIETAMDAIALTFATGLDTASRLNLSVEFQDQDNIPDFGLPWVVDDVPGYESYAGGPTPESLFENFYGNVNRDYEEIETQTYTALYEYDLSESSTLRLQARHATVDRDSVSTSPRFNGGRGAPVTAEVRMNDVKPRYQENEMTAFQAAYISTFTTGKTEHAFSVGVDYYDEKEILFRPTSSDDNLVGLLNDLAVPTHALDAFTGSYSHLGADPASKGASETTAIYVSDTLTLNEKWDISGGLRWENYKNDSSGSGRGGSYAVSREDDMLSWSVSAVYKIQSDATIYFGVGNAFNPAAQDLTGSATESILDPEESLGYELGTKWNLFDDRVLASAAVFYTIKKNARTSAGFGEPQTLDGEQTIKGLELSAVGQVSDELSISAGYTFQDGEVTDDANPATIGSPLARTPKNSMSLWGTYDLNNAWSLGLGAEYVDERTNGTSATARVAPSYTVLDAMVSWQASDKLSLQVNADNLTDEKYVDLVGGGHFVPGPGRYLGLSGFYSFEL